MSATAIELSIARWHIAGTRLERNAAEIIKNLRHRSNGAVILVGWHSLKALTKIKLDELNDSAFRLVMDLIHTRTALVAIRSQVALHSATISSKLAEVAGTNKLIDEIDTLIAEFSNNDVENIPQILESMEVSVKNGTSPNVLLNILAPSQQKMLMDSRDSLKKTSFQLQEEIAELNSKRVTVEFHDKDLVSIVNNVLGR